jgi:hypothetical protein
VLETSSHDWRDIGIYVSGGGTLIGYEAVVSFDGKKYPLNPTVPPGRPLKEHVPGRVVIPNLAFKDGKVLQPYGVGEGQTGESRK